MRLPAYMHIVLNVTNDSDVTFKLRSLTNASLVMFIGKWGKWDISYSIRVYSCMQMQVSHLYEYTHSQTSSYNAFGIYTFAVYIYIRYVLVVVSFCPRGVYVAICTQKNIHLCASYYCLYSVCRRRKSEVRQLVLHIP